MADYGQSLGAALGQFAFGGNTRQAGMKGMLDGSQAANYEAQSKRSLAEALKAEAETRMIRQQEESRMPEAIARNAAASFGVPSDDFPAVEQYLKTGALGGRFAPPEFDGVGPAMPRPDWASQLPALVRSMGTTNRAMALGDKSVENAAKADTMGREAFLGDQVIAGRLDPLKLSQSQFALKGSAPFNFNEYGTGNNLTGTIDDQNGPAQRFAQKRNTESQENQAQAGAAKASAASSYASAGASNARAAQTRQETAQGGRTGQTQIVTDAAGNVTLVDKVTGQARPALYADGRPVGAKLAPSKGDKPLTEGQAKAVAFASRMENSAQIIDDLAKKGVSVSVPGSRAGYGVGAVVSALQPGQRQQLDQAKRDFINAVLRRESGAVISNEEFDNAEKAYFPQANESKETRDQKAKARRIALEGMKADIPASSGDVTGEVIRKASGASADSYGDAEKERRYQEFKKAQSK